MNGSVTGLLGSGQLLDYSMTKGGIHAFTRALASQLVGRGIRVDAIAPGLVKRKAAGRTIELPEQTEKA